MNVNGFMAHQESIRGKLSEVMKMFALDILVLHDVSIAVLCQKEDWGLLKAPTGLTCQAEAAINDIVNITVRSLWAHRGTMMSACFFAGETEQIQGLSWNAMMND